MDTIAIDTSTQERQIIKNILAEYAALPSAHDDSQREVICDDANGKYLLVVSGWDGWKRVYYVLIHVDIVDGKFWIQKDGTEEGVAMELLAAGIPKDQIVLAFRPPCVRPQTEFAVA